MPEIQFYKILLLLAAFPAFWALGKIVEMSGRLFRNQDLRTKQRLFRSSFSRMGKRKKMRLGK